MSKNAIIGGVGFVGINIAEELSKDSNVIIVTRRSSIKKRPNITKRLKELGVELIVLDKINFNNLKNLDVDNFIYTIGIISGNLKEMMEAHVNILDEVIKAAKEISSRVIYISSVGALGEVKAKEGSVLYEEDDHLNKEMFTQKFPYEISKAEGERLLLKNKDELKNKFVILRPTTVFGPYAYESQWKAIYNLAKRNVKIKIGGESLIYSKDLAKIVGISTKGKFDGKWLYVSWPEKIDLEKVSSKTCEYFKKKRCITLPIKGLIKFLYYITPYNSPIKMIYRSVKGSYTFKSKYLDDFKFSSFEEAFNDFINYAINSDFKP